MFLKSPPPLILASTSPYRRDLLARLKIPFECLAPGVDESRLPGENAVVMVARLAREKARAVAVRHPRALIIGSDQMALLIDERPEECLLGKPGSPAACKDQLRACSGNTVAFLTAVAVHRHGDGALDEFVDTTEVRFRELDEATIARYVERESAVDCAGGFKSEALGIGLCTSIASSDPTALIGLPLIRLAGILRAAGFDVP